MKRIVANMGLFLFLVSIHPAFALTINQVPDGGASQVQYYEPMGQSFTATDTDIGYVGLYIYPFNQLENDLTLTMSLFSGDGDFTSGALLESSNFTLVNGFEGWIDLDVSTILFSQNDIYTIGIFNDTAQWGVGIIRYTDPYSGGVAYRNGSPFVGSDLVFRIGPGNIASSPVPEPATIFLLGTGLLGLTGASRKKFKRS